MFFDFSRCLECDASKDMVIVPAASGLMGILPSHAPTVAQLRSGVVEVYDNGEKESYFVSSGFAFVHKDRTDVCAIEAVKVGWNHVLSTIIRYHLNVKRLY